MDLRKFYTIVGCIYLSVLLPAFASSESNEKFETISPSEDQLILEATTESLFENAASNSVYLAGNEEDASGASGDSMARTKEQGHDIVSSPIFSSNQHSHDFNSLQMTSEKQDGASKLSAANQMDQNLIPVTNLSTKHQSKNKEITENPYLATSLSTKIPSHKNNAPANFSMEQHNHDTVPPVTMMTNHLGYNSDPLTQRSTKPQASNTDSDPPTQLSTKQHTFNDDPSTLESGKEKDSAVSKAKSDLVTMLITKSKPVDTLNGFTVKPSSTMSQNAETTKSSTTSKRPTTSTTQGSTYMSSVGISHPHTSPIRNEVPGPVHSFKIETIGATSVWISLEPPKQRNGNILGYLITTINDKFCQTRIINCTGCNITNNPTFALPAACETNLCPKHKHIMAEVETLSKQFKIENLSPYHGYNMTVVAYNKEGCGNKTEMHFTTLESAPSIVRNLQVNLVSNRSVQLKYKPPEHKNGIILNYTVQICYKKHICRAALDNNETICDKFNTSKTEYVFKDLESNWHYRFSVYAWTSKGFGNPSKQTNITTPKSVPSQVKDLKITKVTNTSLEFQWKPPCFPNGNITKYQVEYETDKDIMNISETEAQAGKLQKLHPYKMYVIKVYACTRLGCSKGKSVQSTTLVGTPMNVGEVKTKAINSTSVVVSWDPPEDERGPTNYSVKTLDDGKVLTTNGCQAKGLKSKECIVTGLDEYWEYSFIVTAHTSAGNSIPMTSPIVRTLESTPGYVTDLVIRLKCYTRMYVKWDPPASREKNGIIHKYSVTLQEQYGRNQTQFVNSTHRYQEFTVRPEFNVTIRVRAMTKVGEGLITEETKYIPPGPPVIPDGTLFIPAPILPNDKSKQIAILLPKKFFSNKTNGEPVMWGLILAQSEAVKGNNTAEQMFRNEFDPKRIEKWQDVHERSIIPAYRVTSDGWMPPSLYDFDANWNYILGADKNCDMRHDYCNGYLQSGRSYRIRAFMCTKGGCSKTRYSGIFYTDKDMSAVYITTPILLMVAVVSLAAVFFMWRKQLFCFQKRTNPILSEVIPVQTMGETNKSFIMNHERMSRTIRLDEFHEKVENMRKDSNLIICEEFQLLRSCSPSKSHSAAELQANRTKNRYTNILAFDHSRVKLLPLDDEEGSDYINANYMPGYQSKREYIAAQGPLPGTKDDFWRMIWEQNVSVVVMVTQAVERGRIKCEIYWPTGTDPVYFGDLVVQLRSESNLSDYVLRILDVQLGEEKREVKHFHFLKWPDFGCPANTALLINFIQTVRSYMPYTATGPTIIHCSAGVGRTGTFIAIDWLLQHIREFQDVDIFGLVLEMRNYRVNMVQTEDQYIFIHQCIADHLRQVEGLVEEDVFIDDTPM